MASQCGPDSTKFFQWHSSVGLFQLSFSCGVQLYPASIRWVPQWYPSVHWVNQWHSSVHLTGQCTLAQGKGVYPPTNNNIISDAWLCMFQITRVFGIKLFRNQYFAAANSYYPRSSVAVGNYLVSLIEESFLTNSNHHYRPFTSHHLTSCRWQWLYILIQNDAMVWVYFLRYWPFVRGINRSPVDSLNKEIVMQNLEVFLDADLNKLFNE